MRIDRAEKIRRRARAEIASQRPVITPGDRQPDGAVVVIEIRVSRIVDNVARRGRRDRLHLRIGHAWNEEAFRGRLELKERGIVWHSNAHTDILRSSSKVEGQKMNDEKENYKRRVSGLRYRVSKIQSPDTRYSIPQTRYPAFVIRNLPHRFTIKVRTLRSEPVTSTKL